MVKVSEDLMRWFNKCWHSKRWGNATNGGNKSYEKSIRDETFSEDHGWVKIIKYGDEYNYCWILT